ncbi:MAG: hypothetical protein E6J09_05910, partial [Chloroflexi bacterium]
KPALRGEDATEAVRTLAYVLDRALRLAHPLVPFISETIALQLRSRARTSDDAPSLVTARWPTLGARDLALEERFAVLIELVRAIRNLRQDAGVDPSARVKVLLSGDAKSVAKNLDLVGELTRADVRPGEDEGTPTMVRGIAVRLVVERDPEAERSRLDRDLAEALDLTKRSRELLARPGFTSKAPKDVVEKERAKLAEREARVRLLEAELKKRGG